MQFMTSFKNSELSMAFPINLCTISNISSLFTDSMWVISERVLRRNNGGFGKRRDGLY
jgi:hypothetical protein